MAIDMPDRLCEFFDVSVEPAFLRAEFGCRFCHTFSPELSARL